MSNLNWLLYPDFSLAELRCKHTGKCFMDPTFMERLQSLRNEFGKPMTINSGYRDRAHPAEAGKGSAGVHTLGRGVDVRVQGADAVQLIGLALKHGFTGIGVQQKGATRYIHLDDVSGDARFSRPTIWSY